MSFFKDLGFISNDEKPAVKAKATEPQSAAVYTPPPQATNFSPSPSYSAQSVYAPSAALSQAEQEQLVETEKNVYSIATTYPVFRDFRNASDNPNDLSKLFKMLKAAGSPVTPNKVVEDIDKHLGLVNSQQTEFDGVLASFRMDRIDNPRKQIGEMEAQIARANERIRLAQEEISTATQQITSVRTNVENEESKLSQRSDSFKRILDKIREPLLRDKQLLTSTTFQ